MTIAQYLRVLREQWLVVGVLTALAVLGAAGYALTATPTYQAGAQMFVSTSARDADIGQLTQGSTFTQQRVKSYADLVTSPPVLQAVIDDLGLDTTPQALAAEVTASSPLDTVLLDITVTDASPKQAAAIANAIAVSFPDVVNRLETPEGQKQSPIKVSVTREAVAPSSPVAPRRALDLALGLLVGLGLGVGVAVLRDSLDRTVGGRHQASDVADAPVLGVVGEDPSVPESPLTVHDPFSPRAEAFRQLRTNIRFLSVDHRVSSLVVTGSVESEGKTTTACNLAIALAQNGEDVVLVDADLRRPTVADLFGLPSGVGLTSVLLGDVPLEAALQPWREDLPLRVLAAGPLPPNPSELVGSSRMAAVVRQLTDHGATVVLDSPPLLPVTDAAVLARVTDGALLVTRVASTHTDQLAAAADALRTAGATVLGLVLNRVPRRGKASSYGAYGSGGGYGGYAPLEQSPSERATPEQPPSERAPREQAAREQAASEQAALNQSPSQRPPLERARIEGASGRDPLDDILRASAREAVRRPIRTVPVESLMVPAPAAAPAPAPPAYPQTVDIARAPARSRARAAAAPVAPARPVSQPVSQPVSPATAAPVTAAVPTGPPAADPGPWRVPPRRLQPLPRVPAPTDGVRTVDVRPFGIPASAARQPITDMRPIDAFTSHDLVELRDHLVPTPATSRDGHAAPNGHVTPNGHAALAATARPAPNGHAAPGDNARPTANAAVHEYAGPARPAAAAPHRHDQVPSRTPAWATPGGQPNPEPAPRGFDALIAPRVLGDEGEGEVAAPAGYESRRSLRLRRR